MWIEPTRNVKLGVGAGFALSTLALIWLQYLPGNGELPSFLGFLAVTLCTEAVLAFCWSAGFVFFMQRGGWRPIAFYWAGVPFLAAGIALHWVPGLPGHVSGMGTILVGLGVIVPVITRKIAYPELTYEQVLALDRRQKLLPK